MSANPEPAAEIRPLTAGDDLQAQLDLAERAFGPGTLDRERRLDSLLKVVADGRALGAFTGGRTAGGARYYDMRQWWHGRVVPVAGVASVSVAPEQRGRGVGRRLMTVMLDRIAAAGYPLSVLYPATMPLYRSLGWELAGGRYTASVPGRSLRALMPPDSAVPLAAVPGEGGPDEPALRRAGAGDAAAVLAVVNRVHEAARDCGPITWDAAEIDEWLADPAFYTYLADDGFLAYRWDGHGTIQVDGAEALSAATVRAFWSLIGAHAPVAKTVRAVVGPADSFWWLTREPDASVVHRSMWMLRVVDAPAAIAARGFPAGVSAAVPLQIADQVRPANTGRWALTVAQGRGRLAQVPDGTGPAGPGDRPPLMLGARGLAALYAGTPVVALRQAGLAAGGFPAGDEALDAAFAASAYMLDDF